MASWVIALPAWGGWHIGLCERFAIPSLRAAIARLGGEHRFAFRVMTDQPARMIAALSDLGSVECDPVPPYDRPFDALAIAHREAILAAPLDGHVLPLNADLVFSVEFLSFVDEQFRKGKRAIAAHGMRTVVRDAAPIGADATALSGWAWSNRHPITQELIWGAGKSRLPTVIYFATPDNVVAHSFHLHPIAVKKDRRSLGFQWSVDYDLLNQFSDSEIHIVAENEMAFAEISPPQKTFGVFAPLSVERIVSFGRRRFTKRHLWAAEHGLLVKGERGRVDASVIREITGALRKLHPAEPEVVS